MDAATLQAKLFAGYGKAALRLGYAYTVYRPSSAINPTAAGNVIVPALNATFTSSTTAQFNFDKSLDRENPDVNALADMTGLRAGDIFVNATWGTYFLTALEPIVPPRAIKATQTVNVTRPAAQAGYGAQPYGGSTPATEVPVMTGNWPAAILTVKARGEGSEVNLPGDVRTPGYTIFLPYFSGAALHTSDIIVDSIGRRFIVSSAELTEQGWNCVTRQAET